VEIGLMAEIFMTVTGILMRLQIQLELIITIIVFPNMQSQIVGSINTMEVMVGGKNPYLLIVGAR
jgi:hypothetical protein